MCQGPPSDPASELRCLGDRDYEGPSKTPEPSPPRPLFPRTPLTLHILSLLLSGPRPLQFPLPHRTTGLHTGTGTGGANEVDVGPGSTAEVRTLRGREFRFYLATVVDRKTHRRRLGWGGAGRRSPEDQGPVRSEGKSRPPAAPVSPRSPRTAPASPAQDRTSVPPVSVYLWTPKVPTTLDPVQPLRVFTPKTVRTQNTFIPDPPRLSPQCRWTNRDP